VGENLLNKFTSSSRQVRSSIKYFFKKINLDRNGTFNSMGVIFNIFEGFNSPFNRRRASNALFCKEHTYGIIYSVHHYHCWETMYKDDIYKKKKNIDFLSRKHYHYHHCAPTQISRAKNTGRDAAHNVIMWHVT
jgi:hypothetical protein